MQVAPQPSTDSCLGDLCHRHLFAQNARRRAAGQKKVHRLQNLAASEGRERASADQQRLVDVVVQYGSEVVQVVARQGAAQLLAEEIADRIRMAEPFTLDDLNGSSPPPMDT